MELSFIPLPSPAKRVSNFAPFDKHLTPREAYNPIELLLLSMMMMMVLKLTLVDKPQVNEFNSQLDTISVDPIPFTSAHVSTESKQLSTTHPL